MSHRWSLVERGESLRWRCERCEWAGMAVARRDPPTPSERVASGMVRVLRTLLADAEADLAAERAARRKWELRLRARAQAADYCFDRLAIRAFNAGYKSPSCPVLALLGSGVHGWPKHHIAGPRGVLP